MGSAVVDGRVHVVEDRERRLPADVDGGDDGGLRGDCGRFWEVDGDYGRSWEVKEIRETTAGEESTPMAIDRGVVNCSRRSSSQSLIAIDGSHWQSTS